MSKKAKQKKVMSRENTIIFAALAFFICGLLLTIKPELILAVTTIALAIFLMLCGAKRIIEYFKRDMKRNTEDFDLALGLSAACFGVLLLLKPDILQSVISVFLGMAMLVGGFAKIQMAIDLYRLEDKQWWVMLIGVAVSVTLGILSIVIPRLTAENSTRYAGISLLAEAAVDAVALIRSHQILKKQAEFAPAKPFAPASETKEE